jgi:hypothetical protein
MELTFLVKGEQMTISEDQAINMREVALRRGEKYLDLIKDEEIYAIALRFWQEAPDYFFVIPASSTGKYHWAKDLGGLFDHVLMGMYCAKELAVTFGLTERERDLAIAALAGHDCFKYGIDYDTRYFDMHPFLPRSYYGKTFAKLFEGETLDTIFTAIERHMGNISEGAWTSAGRVKPETPLEQVVHLADYMASRSNIVMTDFIR